MQFNFKKADIAGSVNIVADFHSRLDFKVTEKIHLKIREDIQTSIEMTTSSWDFADEENIFFTQADNEDESKEKTLHRKEQSRQNTKQWIANEEPPSLNTGVKEYTKIDRNTSLYSLNGIKTNAQLWVERDVDLVFKNQANHMPKC